jgi:hypothetical protein
MRSPNQVMPILPDDDRDDAIGRVRFARVDWPNDGKRVRSEDRQHDHRYRERFVHFHKETFVLRLIGCYDASVGFYDAAKGHTATPPLGLRGSASTA